MTLIQIVTMKGVTKRRHVEQCVARYVSRKIVTCARKLLIE